MKQFTRIAGIVFVGCLLAALIGPVPAAAEDSEPWMAKVVSVEKTVQTQPISVSTWKGIKANHILKPEDSIQTGRESRAGLVLLNEAVVRLDEETTIITKQGEKAESIVIELIKGALHFFSREPESLQVETPFVNCSIEGTEFFIRVNGQKTDVSVFRGRVRVYNDLGELQLADGQTAITKMDGAPYKIKISQPRDAVNWALYYPPLGIQDGPGVSKNLYRASTKLRTGRVKEAQRVVNDILEKKPANSDALALKAVINLTLDQKDKAAALAQKAVESDTASSPARLALAYAQQASFDIEAARDTLKEAAKNDPDSALVWAHLSELWLAGGYLDKAFSAARKAEHLSPKTSRAQTVLGYAYLSRIDIDKAEDAFNNAIKFGQADPMPRLGKGLALIRDGKLKLGRKQIEIAASLDPGSSIVRSYLGKAFYEEKRNRLASRQYEVAKELDPNDPTAYFYSAIQKQTMNRPVEALKELQKSITLNDNRAVYRSRLLLDDDLAARSSSIARIYNDLGFGKLALVEGWKSVNTDPSNHSAHRFLADTYAALPRHEIARVSELLQSQLLQPINITPIQPHLAETGLMILEGAGPSELSYNEFNPLFNRNRVSVQTNGVIGGNETLGNDLVLSGVYGKGSFSFGQFHYETDGFRENNYLDDDIYNVFGQVQLSPNTSIQAEYRDFDGENGDLSVLFDPELIDPTVRNEGRTRSYRIGLRHSFTPNSKIIASYINLNLESELAFSGLNVEDAWRSNIVEIQHLFDSKSYQLIESDKYQLKYQLISGVGHIDSDIEETINEMPYPSLVIESDMEYTNAYVYLHSQLHAKTNFNITLGASGDFYEDADLDLDQFNPKFGVTWQPQPTTTFRAAVFRTLKRPKPANQTLEPTQVSGFNQFFDDVNGTKTWRYGVAADHQFTSDLYAGIELSIRDLTVPPSYRVVESDWEEQLHRAYVYWLPCNWLSLRAEYQYERFDLDPEAANRLVASEIRTHRLPLGLGLFHPSGLTTELEASYVHQEGRFPNASWAIVDDEDEFWIVNASVGYRLPKRIGRISINIKNLFDQTFKFQDTDPTNPTIFPEFTVLGRVALAF